MTNQSPELVERRRRYLEIYLQQLTVPRNLFYAGKTALYQFLHDGEVHTTYKSRSHRPLFGVNTISTDCDGNGDNDDDDDNGGSSAEHEGETPRQVVGINSKKLVSPDNVISGAIPDYSSSSANRAGFTKDGSVYVDPTIPVVSGEADDGEDARYRERCQNCGHEEAIDYNIEEWVPQGRCPKCRQFTQHTKIDPISKSTAAARSPSPPATDPAAAASSVPSSVMSTSLTKEASEEYAADAPSEADDDDESPSNRASVALNCSACQRSFTSVLFPHRCQICKVKHCRTCLQRKVVEGEDAPLNVCATCSVNIDRHMTALAQSSSASPMLNARASVFYAADPPPPNQPLVRHEVRSDVAVTDFDLVTTLGRGTFGKVMKVIYKADGKVYAMKVLSKNVIHKRRMIEYIKEEKNIMAFLPVHPFVVTLHFAFQTDHHVYLILDYLPGGELYTHIYPHRNLRYEDARFYIAEIVLAVEHLHRFDVVHRDIKPENIVLDAEGHLKLTDFGLARMNFSRTKRRSFVGSAEYLAPETIQGDVQTRALDWWSVGVMLFEMLSGVAPFHAANNNDVYQAVLHRKLDFSKACFTPSAINIIQKLLEKDVKQRLIDPAKIKAHPFFQGLDWQLLYERKLTPPFVPDLVCNDTKYFSRDFTSEWATIQKGGGVGRQTLELLTRRFSNFKVVEERRAETTATSTSTSGALAIAGGEDSAGPTPRGISTVQLINPDVFVGVWRLVKVEMASCEQLKICFPWGSEVCGMLTYCDNGMFSIQLCPIKRSKFRNAAHDKTSREEHSEAYSSYVAAFGTYEVVPGKNYLIHIASGALCPNLVGVRERRYFELANGSNQLKLMTGPVDDGEMRARTMITWERVAT